MILDAALVGVLLAVAVAGWLWQRAHGVVRPVPRAPRVDLPALGAPAGARVLLLFTAPRCAGCTAARSVLREVAGARTGVAVTIVDVSADLPLARSLGVLRAPTTVVVQPDGTVTARVGGVPSAAAVVAALEPGAVPAA